jgi:hypothetical protein
MTTPTKDAAMLALADALEKADWQNVSIGNKCLIAGAIEKLRSAPVRLPGREEIEKAVCCPEGCLRGDDCWASKATGHTKKVISAILALSAPEGAGVGEPEPVAWLGTFVHSGTTEVTASKDRMEYWRDSLRIRVDALYAAPPAPRADALPISTAPKTGQSILLWWETCGAWAVGRWVVDEDSSNHEGWRCDDDDCIPRNQGDCTYWQPLPSRPADAREGEG